MVQLYYFLKKSNTLLVLWKLKKKFLCSQRLPVISTSKYLLTWFDKLSNLQIP